MSKLCTIFAAGVIAVAAACALSFSVSAAPTAVPPVVVEQSAKISAFTDLAAPSVDRLVVADMVDLKVVTLVLGDGGSVNAPQRSGPRLAVSLDSASAASIVGGASRPAMWPPIAT